MLRLAVVALLAACSEPPPNVEILAPTEGTTISTTGPIVFDILVEHLHPGETELLVDDRRWLEHDWQGGCSIDGGSSQLVWSPTTIANGTHKITIGCVYDLSPVTATVTLVFARP